MAEWKWINENERMNEGIKEWKCRNEILKKARTNEYEWMQEWIRKKMNECITHEGMAV